MNNNSRQTLLGILLAFITIFIWGITFVSTKSLLQNFSALEILFIRFFIAYISLWIIHPKTLKLTNKKNNGLFALAGLTGVTLYQFSENTAISWTTASNVSIIVSICPMFAAIVNQIFLKEKHITKFFVIGFIIALTGIALVSFNGNANFHVSPKGDLLALTAAICWSFYTFFISRINTITEDHIAATRRVFFFAIIFMIPLLIAGKFSSPESFMFINLEKSTNIARFTNLKNLMNLSFLGLFASALCFVLWNKACMLLGSVKATVGIYMIPVVTIIFAFIFLGEKLTIMGLIGTALTICGLFLSEK